MPLIFQTSARVINVEFAIDTLAGLFNADVTYSINNDSISVFTIHKDGLNTEAAARKIEKKYDCPNCLKVIGDNTISDTIPN